MPDSGPESATRRHKRVQSEVGARVAASAAANFGVIAHEQLLLLGATKAKIRVWLRVGFLHRLHRGVYAVGHPRISAHGHFVAALLACGPTSFLSHRGAAAGWGLQGMYAGRIDVTVPGSTRVSRGRLRVHRTATEPHPDEVVTRNGLRMSSVERLLIELAPSESRRSLDNLITAAARKGLLDVFKLNAALERHKRRPGAAKLRGVAKYYLPREDGKSGLERSFHAARAKDPEIPAPATNVYIAGWEIDCWWPALRVALELDGRPYHVAVADTEKDRIKDAKLMAMGIWPMRITDRRWEFDQQGALADLRAVLRRREADGRLGLEQAGPLRPEEEGRREAA